MLARGARDFIELIARIAQAGSRRIAFEGVLDGASAVVSDATSAQVEGISKGHRDVAR